MNWDDKSDFEVNKKLVSLIKDCINWTYNEKDRCYVKFERDGKISIITTHYITDYCNSWADMGPLIEKYGVTLNQQKYSIPEAFCRDNFGFACFGGSHKNIKRAAAICLIKKLEAENAKV